MTLSCFTSSPSFEAITLGVAVILPFIAGLSAALLFAPDDEPALELMLTSPRPVRWVVYERLSVFIAFYLGAGLFVSLLAEINLDQGFGQTVARWLPPTIAICGFSLWASVYGRRTSYGLLAAIVLCAGMAIGYQMLLTVFPDMWPLMFYAQPHDMDPDRYLINRLVLIALGIFFLVLVWLRLGDYEMMFGTGESAKT